MRIVGDMGDVTHGIGDLAGLVVRVKFGDCLLIAHLDKRLVAPIIIGITGIMEESSIGGA